MPRLVATAGGQGGLMKSSKRPSSKHQRNFKHQTAKMAAGGRRDACATFVEAGAVQSLGNQCPSRLVRHCQTFFLKNNMKVKRQGKKMQEASGYNQLSIPMISNQFQSIPITFLSNMETNAVTLTLAAAHFAGRAVSVDSTRGLAGAARAEVRAGLANAPYRHGWQAIFKETRQFPMISNDFQ